MNFDIEINSITIPQKQYNQHIVNLIDHLLFIDEILYPGCSCDKPARTEI